MTDRTRAPVFAMTILLATSSACNLSARPSIEEVGRSARLANIERLTLTLHRTPGGAKTLRSLATEYWAVGQYDDAQAALEASLALAFNADAATDLAALLYQRGRYAYAAQIAKLARDGGAHEQEWLRSFMREFEAVTKVRPVNSRSGAAKSIEVPFVDVPGGEFRRGDDEGNQDDQKPARAIVLSPYQIGKYEVTNVQFKTFVDETAYPFTFSSHLTHAFDDYPVVAVSWQDAQAFTMWLSVRDGAAYRLPTEAEWEFAARGPQGLKQPWGDDPGEPGVDGNWDQVGLFDFIRGAGGSPKVVRVGSYARDRSAFGAFDMAGNEKEWCLDWYDAGYYRWSPSRDPYGPVMERSEKVLRGGAWNNPGTASFTTLRGQAAVNKRYTGFGFRVVRERSAPR